MSLVSTSSCLCEWLNLRCVFLLSRGVTKDLSPDSGNPTLTNPPTPLPKRIRTKGPRKYNFITKRFEIKDIRHT